MHSSNFQCATLYHAAWANGNLHGWTGSVLYYSSGRSWKALPPPPQEPVAPAPPSPPPPTTPDDVLKQVSVQFISVRDDFTTKDSSNDDAIARVTLADQRLKATVAGSDDLFRLGQEQAVFNTAKASLSSPEVSAGLTAQWTPVDDLSAQIKQMSAKLSDLTLQPLSDAQKAKLANLQTQISAQANDLSASIIGGTKAVSFAKLKAILNFWNDSISKMTLDSFKITDYEACNVLFNQNKSIAIRTATFDLLPLFDGQQSTETDSKDPFITVTCQSRFSVSAGVEFSFLGSKTFGIVPSGSQGTNKFGLTDSSRISPLPIAMAHGLVHDWDEHKWGIYVSFGVAAHGQGDNSGGSSADFLTGLSVAFARTIYLTGGWHVGKIASLNGYNVGDTVPTGVTAAPVQSSYKSNLGLALTFTKP